MSYIRCGNGDNGGGGNSVCPKGKMINRGTLQNFAARGQIDSINSGALLMFNGADVAGKTIQFSRSSATWYIYVKKFTMQNGTVQAQSYWDFRADYTYDTDRKKTFPSTDDENTTYVFYASGTATDAGSTWTIT